LIGGVLCLPWQRKLPKQTFSAWSWWAGAYAYLGRQKNKRNIRHFFMEQGSVLPNRESGRMKKADERSA